MRISAISLSTTSTRLARSVMWSLVPLDNHSHDLGSFVRRNFRRVDMRSKGLGVMALIGSGNNALRLAIEVKGPISRTRTIMRLMAWITAIKTLIEQNGLQSGRINNADVSL